MAIVKLSEFSLAFILALPAVAATISTSMVNSSLSEEAKRRDVTITMQQAWNTTEMIRHRRLTWDVMKSHRIWRDIEVENKEPFVSSYAVLSFMRDVKILLEIDAMDKGLARELLTNVHFFIAGLKKENVDWLAYTTEWEGLGDLEDLLKRRAPVKR